MDSTSSIESIENQFENLGKFADLNQLEYYPPNFPMPVRIEDDDFGFSPGIRIQKRNVHNSSIIFNVSSEDNGDHRQGIHQTKIAEDESQPNEASIKFGATQQQDKQLQDISNGKPIIYLNNEIRYDKIILNLPTDSKDNPSIPKEIDTSGEILKEINNQDPNKKIPSESLSKISMEQNEMSDSSQKSESSQTKNYDFIEINDNSTKNRVKVDGIKNNDNSLNSESLNSVSHKADVKDPNKTIVEDSLPRKSLDKTSSSDSNEKVNSSPPNNLKNENSNEASTQQKISTSNITPIYNHQNFNDDSGKNSANFKPEPYSKTKQIDEIPEISDTVQNQSNLSNLDIIPPQPEDEKIGGTLFIMNEYGVEEENSDTDTNKPVRKSTLEYSTELLDDEFFSEKTRTNPEGESKSSKTPNNGTSSSIINNDQLSQTISATASTLTTIPNYIMSTGQKQVSVQNDKFEEKLKQDVAIPNTVEINLSSPCRLIINIK